MPQEWEIDFENLGDVFAHARIQSCNACGSTSMALCVWPCNYYEKQNKKEPDVLTDFDAWADQFVTHVRAKGKVPTGRFRAFGYKAPRHRLQDIRLGWRDVRMRVGLPRKNSSSQKQQAAGLNQDAILHPKRSARRQPLRAK